MTTPPRSNSSDHDRVSRRLMRALWLALTAVHVPILARVTAEVVTGAAAPERVATWLGLLVATAVFGGLAHRGFVRCLGGPRQNFWILCLVTALVHRGAIGLGPGEPMLPVAVVATTMIVGERLWRPGRRFLQKLRYTLVASTPRLLRGGVVDSLRHQAHRARRARLAFLGAPRGPPHAAVPA